MSIRRYIIENYPVAYDSLMRRINGPVQPIDVSHPELYNQFGEKMVWFYLDDTRLLHHPYTLNAGHMPRRVVWDRQNQFLSLHMYNHLRIVKHTPLDNVRQFGIIKEAEIIVPGEYDLLLHNEDKVKHLSALFTFSERLLDKYENARFSLCNGTWYGTDLFGGNMDETNYQRKKKLISIVASNKHQVPLHVFRANTARELKRRGLADAMGRSVGQYFEKISDAFDDYMYNVAIENEQAKFYFTEKILDCFASMTVPVYFGATAIDEFFNPDGIIRIEEPTIECVVNTIKQCSQKDYEARLEAIKDNYHRVQKYLSVDDYLTDNYMSLFE